MLTLLIIWTLINSLRKKPDSGSPVQTIQQRLGSINPMRYFLKSSNPFSSIW